MRILFVILLILFSCNKKQIKIDVAPVVDAIQVRDEQKPLFKLGSVFEGNKSIPAERVPLRMPVWKPEAVKIVRASIVVDTVLRVDTFSFPCTLYCDKVKTEVVHSRGLAYLMLVIGFVCGILLMLLVELYKTNKRIKNIEKRFM